MHPLVCLRIPSTAGRNDMQMRVVLAITPMGLDHDDIAALEGLATHRTKEIVQALHPILHERTEQRFGMLIKWCSQDIRHGEDNMPIVPTLLPLAIVEAKSGSLVRCRRKNTWHAEAAWRLACAWSLHVLLAHPRDVRAAYTCIFSSCFKRLGRSEK